MAPPKIAPVDCNGLAEGYGIEMWFHATPAETRAQCADALYDLAPLRNVDLYAGPDIDHTKPVRHARELANDLSTLTILHTYHDWLKNPPRSLAMMLERIRQHSGKRLALHFGTEPTIQLGGMTYWDARSPTISLFDTLTPTDEMRKAQQDAPAPLSRSISPTMLQHEVGHALMDALYRGQTPDYAGHIGHDYSFRPAIDHRTNPGAAWSEGFADAMGHLEYAPESEVDWLASTYLGNWPDRPLANRLSNEFVVRDVLRTYIGVRHGIPQPDGATVWIEPDYRRLEKVWDTMRQAGVQQSLQEFADDHLYLHPEERGPFLNILQQFAMADVVSGNHFVERRIVQFIRTEDARPASKLDELHPNTVRRRVWQKLVAAHQADTRLTDRQVPVERRLALMEKIDRYLHDAVTRETDLAPFSL